ncbi:MAG: hypothetical protein V4719_10180 [Planctomycetota bacterium]
MDWIQIGSFLDRYGYPVGVSVVITWLVVRAVKTLYRDVILPAGKSLISHIDKTAAANETFAQAQLIQASAMTRQADAMSQQSSTLGAMSDAIKRVACQHPTNPPPHG